MQIPRDDQASGIWQELRTTYRNTRQVWRLVPRCQQWSFGAAALVMALTSASCIAIPLALGRLIDDVRRSGEQGVRGADLYRLAAVDLLLLGGAYLAREAFHVLRRYLVENTCTRIDKEMSVRLVRHLMHMDLAALTHQRVGALHGRIHRSVEGLVRLLRLTFLDFFPAILTGLLALVTTTVKLPGLGLVMAGVIPVSLFLTARQLLSQKGIRLDLLRGKENLDGTVVELLGGLDYVRAAHTHDQEVGRVAQAAEERRATEIRHHVQMSWFGCAKALNEAFFHLLVLAGAVYFAATGVTSFGDVWTFSLLFLNVMTPLSEIHRVIDETHECGLYVTQLLRLLAEPIDRSFQPKRVHEPHLRRGMPTVAVEGLRVDYRTPSGKSVSALKGISLEVRYGETVGVAGPSGSGKSTWLRVLLRLTHPTSGQVWLGGVPLESISRESIGDLVGYVGQTPFLFAGTIAENIAYGTDRESPEAIRRAAFLAHLHDEIMSMPGGYQAAVAERGQNLSGGQRQRLALARVFLKDPPILILDEATSALDTSSERKVQQAIEAARGARTVILVAHRLSTLRHADRIFVFEEGHIAEVGSYPELIHGGGVFAELARCAGNTPEPQGLPRAPAIATPGKASRRAA